MRERKTMWDDFMVRFGSSIDNEMKFDSELGCLGMTCGG